MYCGFEIVLCRFIIRSNGRNKYWGFYIHIWYVGVNLMHTEFLRGRLGLKIMVIMILCVV